MLAANTALVSLGTVGSKLMMFFMVRFYTGYMSPADYGTADIITQTANLLIPLVSLGMAEGVFRFAAMVPDKCREAFTAGIVCTIAGTAMLAAVLPRIPGAAGYGTLLTVYVACSCVHSICAQYVRALGDMAVYAVQGLINTALVIGFNIALLAVFHLGVTGYVLSVAAADAGCTVWLTAKKRLWSALTRHISRPLFRRLVAYSVPLIPTSVFWWITGVSDRYMISGFLSSAALNLSSVVNTSGISFGTVCYVLIAGMLAISAMVLPGISGSSVLMSFGLYLPVIAAVKDVLGFNFDGLWMLCVLAVGIAAGLAVSPHILKKLMERDMGAVLYMVLGMMVG